MKPFFKLVCVGLCFGLLACTSVSVDDYTHNKPVLKLEEFFTGTLAAHGIVKNRNGRVIRYFSADIDA